MNGGRDIHDMAYVYMHVNAVVKSGIYYQKKKRLIFLTIRAI